MGCLGNSKTSEDQGVDEKERREANKKIEKQLQKERLAYKATHRLLLLGKARGCAAAPGQSGAHGLRLIEGRAARPAPPPTASARLKTPARGQDACASLVAGEMGTVSSPWSQRSLCVFSGAGESGKSTIVKQMRILHVTGFNPE